MKKAVVTIILPILLALACLGWTQARPECASTIAALEDRVEAQRRLLTDWAGLIRYGSENTELPKPMPDEDRVVFLGDEITERWGQGNAKFFPGKPYLNRGVKGQTTPQMLVRLRQDVILLKPKVVVILAGMNDIAVIATSNCSSHVAAGVAERLRRVGRILGNFSQPGGRLFISSGNRGLNGQDPSALRKLSDSYSFPQ